MTTANDLGVQFESSRSPLLARLAAFSPARGEGVRAIAFRTADLEASIAKAESLGLQLVAAAWDEKDRCERRSSTAGLLRNDREADGAICGV